MYKTEKCARSEQDWGSYLMPWKEGGPGWGKYSIKYTERGISSQTEKWSERLREEGAVYLFTFLIELYRWLICFNSSANTQNKYKTQSNRFTCHSFHQHVCASPAVQHTSLSAMIGLFEVKHLFQWKQITKLLFIKRLQSLHLNAGRRKSARNL